ncbi:hypothetical protein DL546_007826 [Coniochaeta pulveracea]|uniref:Small ribosomal subunit protein bS18m n=1 Tax=Coniochaeta pulveracea TaxID=177199 RepID=A0A420YFD6_9PEZI|nr:hypothetical protein DL546_007826 [Coniochaeta pulveracea]
MTLRIPTPAFAGIRQLSTTSSRAAFKDLPNATRPSSASNLLSMDSPSPSASSTHDALASVLRKTDNKGWTSKRARAAAEKPSTKEELRNRDVSEKLSRLMPRFWRDGDVYAPADLNANEARKWRGKGNAPDKDVCDLLGVNPLDMYRNFSVIGDFITPFGRIKHSSETGLRPVNQRRMAKAIRRAIGLGIHPSVYRHPMILLRNKQT